MKTLWDETYHFATSFVPETGFYFRTDCYDTEGRPTGQDPFMSEFPHLLDVGIMGHCQHGLSGLCLRAGVQCYQDGLHKSQHNMSFENFHLIALQCQGRVFQFALGGRGDPEMHEDFERILECCRNYSIVPNTTTSGFGLTADKARHIGKYCGAAAVSWYGTDYTLKALDLLLSAGVTTNIHYVLSNSSIDEAIRLLETRGFPPGIKKVIFLLHKPVGLGSQENVLKIRDARVRHFFKLFDQPEICALAGFDSCCIPGLMNMTSRIYGVSLDTCEGARYSAYISPDMKMLPCSFDQQQKWGIDLRDSTIEAAWDSSAFSDFRNRLRESCPDCSLHDLCMGGCPINKEIVLCGTINGGGLLETANRIRH
jgi:radical SAM protein with 4Fe4S-binding SPASM domain